MSRTTLRQRVGGPGMFIIVALVVVLAALAMVIEDTVLLRDQNEDIAVAQSRASALNGFSRGVLKLRQNIIEYGVAEHRSATQRELVDRRDQLRMRQEVCLRQLYVASVTFDEGSAERQEITRIRDSLAGLPLAERLESPTAKATHYATELTALNGLERQAEHLRGNSEVNFYNATVAILDYSARNQVALGVLVVSVTTLSAAAIVVLIRRRRNDVASAYEALKVEMSERRAAEAALRASEGRFRSLVQRASDLTLVTDADGVVSYASPAVEGILGVPPEALTGRPIIEFLHPDDGLDVEQLLLQLCDTDTQLATVELRMAAPGGQFRILEALCRNLLTDPNVHGVVWNGRDVTDRKLLADELEFQAHHDSLTGLPNRGRLLSTLDDLLRERNSPISVILVDLDGFKNVNDSQGHPAGDELLQRVAERLRGCVLGGDVVARLGGDEFAVVVAGQPAHAVAVARRVVAALGRTVTVGGRQMSLSASLGVAHRGEPGSATTSADLLRDADIAMYVAKSAGKGRYEVFVPAMRLRAAYRNNLQQDLAYAVDRGQIEVMYQPIVRSAGGHTVLVEALARWRHPERGLISPAEFIPLAEEFGMINQIGREVLRQACLETATWRGLPGQHDLGVSVNVSLNQVLSGDLVEHVRTALAESGLPARALTLEITESVADESEEASPEFARLKRLGVRLALDDFGSGYSSLEFLMRLDADEVKIDRTLLDCDIQRDGSMVRAITHLGHTLGLRVVVEGVETSEHLSGARAAGCDLVQGFLFARPMPASQVADHLTSEIDWDTTVRTR